MLGSEFLRSCDETRQLSLYDRLEQPIQIETRMAAVEVKRLVFPGDVACLRAHIVFYAHNGVDRMGRGCQD